MPVNFFPFAVDRCPMYFNDGSDPWNIEENHIRVFDFSNLDQYNGSSNQKPIMQFILIQLLAMKAIFC